MANERMTLRVKTGEKDGKNYWDNCGVLFINRNRSCRGSGGNLKAA